MAETPNQQIDGPDITNYWQYFQLDRDPFAMTATDSLVYISSYWEETIDLIQYLVHYKNQLIVVTGASGSGKSTLVEVLLDQLNETVNAAKINAEANLDVPRLIEFLSDAFTLPWHPEHSIEQVLDEQLQTFQQKERPCLLVIDNAQQLPTETIEALLYLVGQQSEHQMRFHVILVGEPALQQTLQRLMEPAEEGLVHFLSIEPLSLSETQLYLNHRLLNSAWQGESPMTEEIVARIYRLSEGNPARINRIARRVLLDILTQQQSDDESGWWQRNGSKVIGALLIIILLVAVALWFTRNKPNTAVPVATSPTISVNGQAVNSSQAAQTTELTPPAATNAPAPANSILPPVTPAAPANVPAATTATGAAPALASAPVQAANPADSTAPAVKPVAITASGVKTPQAEVTPAPVASANAPAPLVGPLPTANTAPAPAASAPVAATTTAAAPVVAKTQSVTSQSVAPAPEAVPTTAVASQAAPAATATAEPAAKPAAKPAATKHHVKPTVAAPKTVKKAAVKPVVKAAKPSHAVASASISENYSIRLIGVSSSSMKAFAKSHGLNPNKLFTKRVTKNGKTTTVVLYGRYKTMQEANRALTTLPSSVNNAWPVSVKEINP